ncbi:MAG: hypothetical protein ACT4TC_12260 [Myxococcaceae bacterium]
MLYKVTPMMTPPAPEKKAREPGQPRKKRKSAVYDHEGNEVFLTLKCLKCQQIRPLQQFGLRKMADGVIRNQPWCRTCRSGAGTKKTATEQAPAVAGHDAAEASAPAVVTSSPVAG